MKYKLKVNTSMKKRRLLNKNKKSVKNKLISKSRYKIIKRRLNC